MSGALHSHDLTRTLQEEIRERLQENAMLFAPPRTLVISENIGDIEKEIEKAIGPLNTGGGVIILSAPEVGPTDPKQPWMMTVSIKVQCLELSIVNRSTSGNQVWAERLAEIVNVLLLNYEAAQNGWSAMTRTEWRSGPSEKFNGYIAEVLTFQTMTCYSIVEVD